MATESPRQFAGAPAPGKGLTAGSRGGVDAGQSAGAGEGEPGKKASRARSNSVLPIRGGKREMKAYAVTEDELENLGLLSIATTASFSMASFLSAFCLSIWTSIAFSADAEAHVVAWWQGISTAAALFAFGLFVLGIYLFFRGRSKIGKIKNDTQH